MDTKKQLGELINLLKNSKVDRQSKLMVAERLVEFEESLRLDKTNVPDDVFSELDQKSRKLIIAGFCTATVMIFSQE